VCVCAGGYISAFGQCFNTAHKSRVELQFRFVGERKSLRYVEIAVGSEREKVRLGRKSIKAPAALSLIKWRVIESRRMAEESLRILSLALARDKLRFINLTPKNYSFALSLTYSSLSPSFSCSPFERITV